MDLIKNLLARYKNLAPKDDFKKEAVIKVLKEKLNIELNKKDVTFSHHRAYLKTSPKIKGEVFINKRSILANLKELLGENYPNDIS